MGIQELPRRLYLALVAVAGLCLLAYARALSLPLISDDYLQIQLGRDYGPVSGWPNLAADALYRCRATSILLTHWTERLFGLTPLVFNLSSLLLHVINAWLVLALGFWRVIGWRISCVAACFFAVAEGHQEAVMWYAALPELLVFTFALGSMLLWIAWLQGGERRRLLYAASFVCYLLALLSKESGVAVVPLLALVVLVDPVNRMRRLAYIVPFAALAVIDFAMIYGARSNHLHFQDGTFSIHGPFWIVIPVSVGRLLWFWGFASLILLAWLRARQSVALLAVSAVWIVVTLLPYSFLTYMPRVPSRHTYFASVGLALVFAAGFLTFREHFQSRRWVIATLSAVVVLQHCIYLWTRKHEQFMERAAPTESLLSIAKEHGGPIHLGCFPYDRSIAKVTLEVMHGDRIALVFADEQEPADAPRVWDLCGSKPLSPVAMIPTTAAGN
jgi:hypothetical protein